MKNDDVINVIGENYSCPLSFIKLIVLPEEIPAWLGYELFLQFSQLEILYLCSDFTPV